MRRLLLASWLVANVACFTDQGVNSSTGDSGSTSTSAATTEAGTTEVGGETSTTTTNPQTSSSSGSTGTDSGSDGSTGPDVPPMLIDRGLLVRYFIDEADAGQPEVELVDVAPGAPAFPLQLTYQSNPDQPTFFAGSGRRGLEWVQTEAGGVASRTIASGDKLVALTDSTTATLEMVVEVDQVASSGSRLFHIGDGTQPGLFTLRPEALGEMIFTVANAHATRFPINLGAEARMVLHLVYDSGRTMDNRAMLYVNGLVVSAGPSDTIPEDLGLPTTLDNELSLGNRAAGDRSFDGRVYYAAVYSVALEPGEVVANANALSVADDG